MIFPDQSHINRIREALWKRPESNASIMIGTGFSRNARKLRSHVKDFPLWNDVAKELCTKLYPADDGDRLNYAMNEASGTSGFLRLAQEYEAAFGRVSLHNLIHKLVPDEEYVPDEMHKRLLSLPWRDVFTTNWDTLVERSRALVVERAYSVVHTIDEIPTATKPRIVKLHGSFPAHIPYIFTEEDYRTYPKRFAPFVNTVQQAMMETVFCLIGFSGDDPNFLSWSGWVRDNLGESSPKIYLAGWLDLSPHRRRMLESRNVVPIDLSNHPKGASWPEHLRHKYASEWIIQTLERGKPYDVTEWPSIREWERGIVPEFLQPVDEVIIDEPKKEPDLPQEPKPSNLKEIVFYLISVWRHNRTVYPGWLILPPDKHHHIVRNLNSWEKAILKIFPELQPAEKLSVLFELVWRREKLLDPLSEEVEAAILSILSDIDCINRKIRDSYDTKAPWIEIREMWRYLAMSLLTESRLRFDHDAFQRYMNALLPFMDDHSDVTQHIHHEKCLWALYCLDFSALDKLLNQWHPEGSDPIWMARKSSILLEINRDEEAVRLINQSLSIVRDVNSGEASISSLSRESWILWMAMALNFFPVSKLVDAPKAFRRWSQLSDMQCDAFEQKQAFLRKMLGEVEINEAPRFDLGAQRGESIRISNIEDERIVAAARRVIRLCEIAGLPTSANNVTVASDILSLASERLVNKNFNLSSRIAMILSGSENDRTFNQVWSRYRIAALSMEDVNSLVDLVNRVISYSLPKANNNDERSIFWITKLRVAMEALSRLVLRLPVERVEEVFKQAMGFYRMDWMSKEPWLGKVIENLLVRSWEALPKANKTDHIFEMLNAPIIGLDGFGDQRSFHADTSYLLENDSEIAAPERGPDNESQWVEIVQLCIRGLKTNGEARKRAAIRLAFLAAWDRISDNEKPTVSQALWQLADNEKINGIPKDTDFFDWAFLLLPEPETGIAEKLFREKWFKNEKPNREERINEYLWKVGCALNSLKNRKYPLLLSNDERLHLTSIIEAWINLPLPSPDNQILRRYVNDHALMGLY